MTSEELAAETGSNYLAGSSKRETKDSELQKQEELFNEMVKLFADTIGAYLRKGASVDTSFRALLGAGNLLLLDYAKQGKWSKTDTASLFRILAGEMHTLSNVAVVAEVSRDARFKKEERTSTILERKVELASKLGGIA